MRLLPIIFLLLSSVFVFSGCSISKYKHLKCTESPTTAVSQIVTPSAVLKYKASIDVLKNHLTGLLIVKQTDSTTKHLVFVTELGMKMFDFEAGKDSIKAIYVFEPLNKPLLIESLKRNFSNMFLLNTNEATFSECTNKNKDRIVSIKKGKDTWFYVSPPNDSKEFYPRLQETYHKRKRSSKIEYVLERSSTWQYTHIKCKQYGLVKFYFELNAINPPNE